MATPETPDPSVTTGSGILGILGGMGPLATADFLAKVTARTPAHRDQDHLRTIVYSDPSTPDRTAAIVGEGPSPLPQMLEGIDFLNRSGCTLIAIPCNTAHHWYTPLSERSRAPILHIVDAFVRVMDRSGSEFLRIGLMATEGTVRARIYHDRLAAAGRETLTLSDLGPGNPVMAGITAVKGGGIPEALELFHRAGGLLRSRGAECLVFGCTEVSGVLGREKSVAGLPAWDASDTLAASCIEQMAAMGASPMS
jgi:aspartate racemase